MKLAAILLCALLLVSCTHGSYVKVINKCGRTIDLVEAGPGYLKVLTKLNNGASVTYEYGRNGQQSFNLREGNHGKPVTLFEATMNGWGNQDNYNLSLVDDFDIAMFLDPPSGHGCNSGALNCPAAKCSAAYLFPSDNSKMHTCTKTGGTFTLYLCKR